MSLSRILLDIRILPPARNSRIKLQFALHVAEAAKSVDRRASPSAREFRKTRPDTNDPAAMGDRRRVDSGHHLLGSTSLRHPLKHLDTAARAAAHTFQFTVSLGVMPFPALVALAELALELRARGGTNPLAASMRRIDSSSPCTVALSNVLVCFRSAWPSICWTW